MRTNSNERTVKKRALGVTSFADATKIVVAVNRLSGLRPLHYSDTKFWMFLNFSYRMIMVTTAGYVMYWIYIYKLLNSHSTSKDRVVYLSVRIVNFLCFVCIQFLGSYHSDQIPGLRRKIAVLEDSLAKLGAVSNNNRTILLWTVGTYTTSLLHTLIVFCLLGYWIWPSPFAFYRIFFSFITNIGSQVLLDFVTYACWLKCSFEQTNDLLKELLVESRWTETGDPGNDVTEDKSDRRNVQRDRNKRMLEQSLRRIRVAPLNKIPNVKHELQAVNKVHILQEIRCIHLHLFRIMKTLNKIYDAQITIYTFVLIINFVVILFNVYTVLGKFNQDPNGLIASAVPMLDVLYTCAKITATCYVCEGTVKEMKKVVEIVHKSSVSDFDVDMKDEIWQFSLQLSLNRVCNIEIDSFRLSFSYMRQCASSITTYLIILIQWVQSIRLNATESFQAQFNVTKRD